jgi:hypothetical protein
VPIVRDFIVDAERAMIADETSVRPTV